MKEVMYRRKNDIKHGKKSMGINTHTEDAECSTNVRKKFSYGVTVVPEVSENVPPPEVFIHKECNTRKKTEKFHFEVKGYFFMSHKRRVMKVRFHHSLDIFIRWKRNFSPKKSEVLTD